MPLPPITVPTLGVWSTGDSFLTEEAMVASGDHVASSWRYARIDGAGHWMQLDQPERVNRLLIEFLGAHAVADAAPRARKAG
jgi:pimeloyl-ACP methyl ester carboxylesterase